MSPKAQAASATFIAIAIDPITYDAMAQVADLELLGMQGSVKTQPWKE